MCYLCVVLLVQRASFMFVVYVVHMLCCSHVELVCVFSIPLCLRVFPCVCCGDSLSVCCVCVCVCVWLSVWHVVVASVCVLVVNAGLLCVL